MPHRHLLTASLCLALTACATQAPPPLTRDHPAHPDANASAASEPDAAALLGAYRDFTPPARGASTAPATTQGGSDDHRHH